MKIDYEELQMAMNFHNPYELGWHYLDKQTGEVLSLSDWVQEEAHNWDDPGQIKDETIRLAWYLLWNDGEVGPELPEAEEKIMMQQVEDYLARFLAVPQEDSREGYRDMVNFANTVTNLHLRDLLGVALNGRGAFRRFKDVLLDHPRERERWFAFSAQAWRQRIDSWLHDEGLLPEENS